jgi:hypothetical protein
LSFAIKHPTIHQPPVQGEPLATIDPENRPAQRISLEGSIGAVAGANANANANADNDTEADTIARSCLCRRHCLAGAGDPPSTSTARSA